MCEYKAGDIVRVWSLQSFSGGGFLEGVEGVVRQDQVGSSVLVAVERMINGRLQVDPSYEVYARQLELVHRPEVVPVNLRELIHRLKVHGATEKAGTAAAIFAAVSELE
jgi:hypothetical protein